MTLDEYRRLAIIAHETRTAGRWLLAAADRLDSEAIRLAGVTHVDREPGFPCWQIEGVEKWFNSPEEAIEHKEQRT